MDRYSKHSRHSRAISGTPFLNNEAKAEDDDKPAALESHTHGNLIK